MENPDSETATLMGIANTFCSLFLFLYENVKLKDCNMLHVGLKWLYYEQSEISGLGSCYLPHYLMFFVQIEHNPSSLGLA